ncbi:MAG: hypothetical protein ACYYKD_05645 [Rhodospirillales bacterium]
MKAVFDATILVALLQPESRPPVDPDTNRPVENVRERLNLLVNRLSKEGSKIIIPAPALSEVLVRADQAAPEYLAEIKSSSVFQVAAFDERCAVEAAAMTREAMDAGDKRGGVDDTMAKIKYDRQIIAISRVAGAEVIYSDDKGLAAFGRKIGLAVVSVAELPTL